MGRDVTDHRRLLRLDREHVWHPFTQMAGWIEDDPLIIESAQGCWLVDDQGNRYLDAVSSLWVNVHGHRRPELDAAVRAQLDRVAHSTLLGLASVPSIELAARLVDIAPDGLTRVFYSDSGSTAVEVALKVCYQYQQQVGATGRTAFATLRGAYHGDTIGAVSLGGIDLFHATYKKLLFDAHPVDPFDDAALEPFFETHGDTLAAFVMEPLVQGAAGIVVHPRGFLTRIRALCDRHEVLLVLDEVATGFGRTGKMFACEHEDVQPDVLCLAKGLTAGYLPLAATLFTERIYDAFLGPFDSMRTFFHGHTYTGNPLACAAALASLELFRTERTLERLEPRIAQLASYLVELAEHPRVVDVRHRGFMAAVELGPYEYEERIGHEICMAAREQGVIFRPLGNAVVLMPPLSISETELAQVLDTLRSALDKAAP